MSWRTKRFSPCEWPTPLAFFAKPIKIPPPSPSGHRDRTDELSFAFKLHSWLRKEKRKKEGERKREKESPAHHQPALQLRIYGAASPHDDMPGASFKASFPLVQISDRQFKTNLIFSSTFLSLLVVRSQQKRNWNCPGGDEK